ncbi:MAG: hypothetical protein HY865_03790 [Chloroflexi bacterium]|nr:hypothetical protein [Chloroflexota bacterium]
MYAYHCTRYKATVALADRLNSGSNGVKANYDDDSSQYEMVGGTRLSERKSPTRKAKA